MPRQRYRLAGFLIASLAVWNCAGKSTPAPTSQSASTPAATGINQLASIAVEDRGDKTGIVITGSQVMSPNIFKLTDPHRIIIDLPDTKLGSVQTPLDVNQGAITQVTSNQFDDAQSSLSRIVVGLKQPAEYQVESDSNRLVVSISKGAASESPTEAGLPEVPSFAEAPTPAPAEVTPVAPVAEPAPSPAAEATPVIEPVPAAMENSPATELTDIQYSSSDAGTTVTLIANGPVGEYKDMVLSKPKRLVIDLQGVKNSYPGGKSVSLGTPEVEQVRLGKSNGQVRVVLDLKPAKGKPAYTIQKEGSTLVLNVAAPPAPSETTSETPVATAETTPEVLEPTAETVPAIAPVPGGSSSGPVLVTGLGFKQMTAENKSRLIIGLSEATGDFSTREAGPGHFVVEISNAKLEKKLRQRDFNTSEFKTAIVNVSPKENRKARKVEFDVELEQQVAYNVTQDGANLNIDVEIPAQILRKQTGSAKVDTAKVPSPPEEEGGMTAESEETRAAELEGAREEKLVVNEPPANEPVDLRPKNYKYVKEGFMSDAMAKDEPLSAMGQILSGEFEGRRFTGRKISLDFKDADIRSIFRLIADISKLNMIISDEVTGNVTVRLDNVPWDQAFAIILQTKGLWFEKYGNIIRIAPADKLSRERELAAAAARAAKAAKPLDVLFKPVSFADAGTLIAQVRSVLSDRGTVDIDSRTNTLIIKDVREHLDKAKKMVDILDTQTPQVTIEARIVQARSQFSRHLGVSWNGNARFTPATGNPTGVYFPNSVAISPFALNFPYKGNVFGENQTANLRLGSINNVVDLDAQIAFGEFEGYSKLVGAPKVTVLDNQSATITSGSKIPFITQTQNAGSNVRFETAATTLSVTPHITNEGSVLLNVTATESAPNLALSVQGNPAIDVRSATTQVLVKSGSTTAIGGIYRQDTFKGTDRFPFLGSIPIIGWFFRSHGTSNERNELLIFVTPRIVGDEREAVRDVRG